MSTNKTRNYGLHQWLPEDHFLREEVNENFGAVDSGLWGLEVGKSRVVTGSFVCTGADIHIDLGGRPAAVLVEDSSGIRYTSSNHVYGGLVCGDKGLKGYVTLDDTGFTLTAGGSSNSINTSGSTKMFLAVME